MSVFCSSFASASEYQNECGQTVNTSLFLWTIQFVACVTFEICTLLTSLHKAAAVSVVLYSLIDQTYLASWVPLSSLVRCFA